MNDDNICIFNNSVSVDEIWTTLSRHHDELFESRSRLVLGRIKYLIRTNFDGIVKAVAPDGNCLANAFAKHRYDFVFTDLSMGERKAMVKLTIQNRHEFQTIMNPQQYLESGIQLLGEHIRAWHIVRKVNVILLEYKEKTDYFDIHFFWKREFHDENKRVCGLLYTHFAAGHYSYISLPYFPSNFTPEQWSGYATAGHKWSQLVEFDKKHGILNSQ
eukprot:91406_1